MNHQLKLFNTNQKKTAILLFCIGFVFWVFCLPKTLFDDPTSTVVESEEGFLLGARIADDGQWRFPKKDSVPYRFEQAILHFEDEYFYRHPGFNPVSMVKAFYQNIITDKRRGASTISQQVIRLSRKDKKRTYIEKLIELAQATRLEVRYNKEEILSFYVSYAPFGGNVVGLETAAWRYFGVAAEDLSWGQSAALAVLPNAPALVFPGKNEVTLKKKRDRLLKKLFEKGIIDEVTFSLSVLEDLPGKPFPLPDIAPHFIEKVRKAHPGQRVHTTVKFDLQSKLNHIANNHYSQLKQNEIHNIAILVLEVDTRRIIGYVGNAIHTKENLFVDVIDKPRSSGSLLKPFLYASMLHSGEILPKTLIADIPTVINGYSPKNFDRTFQGAVPVNRALNRSLNVPAVRMLQTHGLDRFYNKLKVMGMEYLNRPSTHYGLSLILGGGETSLLEITNAYAGLASTVNFFNTSSSEYRSLEFAKPVFLKNQKTIFGTIQQQPPLFNTGAIYKTLNSLKETNRPEGEEHWSFYTESKPLAWKTGTSFGFKDAWAIGVTPDYAIGVWVGNADGEGRPGLTGIQSAAPVLFDVLKVLDIKRDWFEMPYDDLVEVDICIKSGHRAGFYCDETKSEWIPVAGLKTLSCPYHSQIILSADKMFRVNSDCYPLENSTFTDWFALPPVMEYYYASLHPNYKTLPPWHPNCSAIDEEWMEFIFPKKNEKIILPNDFDEQINEVVFKLAHRNQETTVFWYLDATFVGKTETFHELALVPKPGKYFLTAIDSEGNKKAMPIEIKTIDK